MARIQNVGGWRSGGKKLTTARLATCGRRQHASASDDKWSRNTNKRKIINGKRRGGARMGGQGGVGPGLATSRQRGENGWARQTRTSFAMTLCEAGMPHA